MNPPEDSGVSLYNTFVGKELPWFYSKIRTALRIVLYRTIRPQLAKFNGAPIGVISVPLRRLEDRIRELCSQAISSDDQHMLPIFEELRDALHNHAVRLRESARSRLAVGLPVTERRVKTPGNGGSANGGRSKRA